MPADPTIQGFAPFGGFANVHGTEYRLLTGERGPLTADERQALTAQGWTPYLAGATEGDVPPRHGLLVRRKKAATEPAGEPPAPSPPAPAPVGTLIAPGDLSGVKVVKGGTYLLQRGASYTGNLPLADGVTWAATGTGPRPVVRNGWVCDVLKLAGVTIRGISFVGDNRKVGLRFFKCRDVHLDGCEVAEFRIGVSFEADKTGRAARLRMTDCVVRDNAGNGYAHGLFVSHTDGIELAGCVFDRNGWNDKFRPTVFNHNVYLHGSNGPATVKACAFARASSHGLQARTGGEVVGCLFFLNPIHLSFGHVNGEGPAFKGGVTGRVHGNVFVGNGKIDGQAKGRGIDIANVLKATITDNVFQGGGPDHAIRLEFCNPDGTGSNIDKQSVGIRDLSVTGNRVAPGWPDFWRHPKAGVRRLELQMSFDGAVPDLRPLVKLDDLRSGKTGVAVAVKRVMEAAK